MLTPTVKNMDSETRKLSRVRSGGSGFKFVNKLLYRVFLVRKLSVMANASMAFDFTKLYTKSLTLLNPSSNFIDIPSVDE